MLVVLLVLAFPVLSFGQMEDYDNCTAGTYPATASMMEDNYANDTASNGSCVSCDELCVTCFDKGPSNCFSCVSVHVRTGEKNGRPLLHCLIECPPETAQLDGSSLECILNDLETEVPFLNTIEGVATLSVCVAIACIVVVAVSLILARICCIRRKFKGHSLQGETFVNQANLSKCDTLAKEFVYNVSVHKKEQKIEESMQTVAMVTFPNATTTTPCEELLVDDSDDGTMRIKRLDTEGNAYQAMASALLLAGRTDAQNQSMMSGPTDVLSSQKDISKLNVELDEYVPMSADGCSKQTDLKHLEYATINKTADSAYVPMKSTQPTKNGDTHYERITSLYESPVDSKVEVCETDAPANIYEQPLAEHYETIPGDDSQAYEGVPPTEGSFDSGYSKVAHNFTEGSFDTGYARVDHGLSEDLYSYSRANVSSLNGSPRKQTLDNQYVAMKTQHAKPVKTPIT